MGWGGKEEEKKGEAVVKLKPHVRKRSLTSASALYCFLTAAHIPAVKPTCQRGGSRPLPGEWRGLAQDPQNNTGLIFIIFVLHLIFFILQAKETVSSSYCCYWFYF